MATKPNGRVCAIREQIIEDMASGLTLQIAFAEDDDEAPFRLRIYGRRSAVRQPRIYA